MCCPGDRSWRHHPERRLWWTAGVADGSLEFRWQRSWSLGLAGLMGVFFVFAVAVLLDESLLAGNGLRSINHRGTQVAFACMMFALVARMLPMALADLLDERPAVRLDATGGVVRSFVRRRRFRWEDVVALDGSPQSFKIRLARGWPIRVIGKFEGDPEPNVRSHARRLWTAAVTP
jgi:hypothetical protein